MDKKTKIIIAVVCLVLAGVALAWNAGLLSGGKKSAGSDPRIALPPDAKTGEPPKPGESRVLSDGTVQLGAPPPPPSN
jgi:hypothetical protein